MVNREERARLLSAVRVPRWFWLLVALAAALPGARAAAQPLSLTMSGPPLSKNAPITFLADKLTYDRGTGVVRATGHVEAWQGARVLQADSVVYDRNTEITVASGHVVVLEPNGQVLFADHARLSRGMENAVLTGISVRLAENARMIANGGRRIGGKLNELARAVYSTCNLCVKDPRAPPLWQISAARIVQDLEHKRIEYYDATMHIYGLPVFYFPYFWTPSPEVKRASGLLVPAFGISSHLGGYLTVPYYVVLDGQSDVVVSPTLTTRGAAQLNLNYRRRFNNGEIHLNGYAAYDQQAPQGAIFASGIFDYNDTYRYGFTVDRASSPIYLRDFGLPGDSSVLPTNAYVEGFGQGAYTRLDAQLFQGFNSSINNSALPLVLPHWQYHFQGEPDALGGRLSVDAGAFNVIRTEGANVERADTVLNWERPWLGPAGTLWSAALHLTTAAYHGSDLNEQPDYFPFGSSNTARALPQAALNFRWPLLRSGSLGSELIEPIVQLIAAPNAGSQARFPNEDSLYLEFTDANLFGWNKFTGIDREESGVRANYALHGAWYVGGATLDGLIGQSWHLHKDPVFPVDSGLDNTFSDLVSRLSFVPNPWLSFNWQGRYSISGKGLDFTDATANFGSARFRFNIGYLYTPTNPFALYTQPPGTPQPALGIPRNEVSYGASSQIGGWQLSGFARQNIENGSMVSAGINGSYQNECLIVAMLLNRRFTALNGDNGATTFLVQITFKTIGQFGFNAL